MPGNENKKPMPDKCPHCGSDRFASPTGGFDIFQVVDGALVYQRTDNGDGMVDELLCAKCWETIPCDTSSPLPLA